MNGIFCIKESTKMMTALILVLLAMWGTGLSYANISPQSLQQIPDQTSYREVSILGHGSANSIAWSPDGDSLIVAGSLGLWLYEDNFQVVTHLVSTSEEVLQVVWSPDSTQIAGTTDNHQIYIWDASNGTLLRILQGYTDFIRSMKWSPDGTRLATSGLESNVRIWDATTGELLTLLEHPARSIGDIAWNGDGTQLASISTESAVYIWNMNNYVLLSTFPNPNGLYTSVSWHSPNVLAIANFSVILILDVSTGREEQVLQGNSIWYGNPATVEYMAMSPSGNQLASGVGATIEIWDLNTLQIQYTLEGHTDRVRDLKWSLDGSYFASTDYSGQTVRIWDTATGKLLTSIEGHTAGINQVAWMLGNDNIAASYFDGTVRIWNTQLTSVVSSIPLDAWLVSWNSDWSRVAGLSRSSEHPTVWNWAELYEDSQTMISTTGLDAGQYLIMEYRPYLYDISSIVWNPNGDQVAVSSRDGRVYILDAATGSEVYVFEEAEEFSVEAWQVAWNPDGSRLAGLILGLGIQIWNTNDGTANGMLSPVDEWMWRIAWSPDGKYLVGGTVQGDIILWNASTYALIFKTSGHTDVVNELAWHPNSNILASGSNDGTIILWDVNTGDVVATLTGHNGPVTALAWNSDGTQLASGGEDGTIRIWTNE